MTDVKLVALLCARLVGGTFVLGVFLIMAVNPVGEPGGAVKAALAISIYAATVALPLAIAITTVIVIAQKVAARFRP